MFVGEWTLLVGVTLDASSISTRRQSCLFQLEAAVRIVTVAATHRAFQHFVMERHIELRLNFVVTARAELRVVRPQHSRRREAGLFGIDTRHLIIRARQVSTSYN